MAIPELEQRRVDVRLQKFSDRVPEHVRDKLSYQWSTCGDEVTLFEHRPAFQRPGEFTDVPFVKFRFAPQTRTWSLNWADRNGRFHAYEGFECARHFDALVDEVEADPNGIFLG